MSHFTKVKTKMRDVNCIKKALDDLGFKYRAGNVAIRGWLGGSDHAEICVAVPNSNHDIGFRRAGDAYEVVADWYGIKAVTEKTFVQQVNQRYAYHVVVEEMAKQNFEVAEQKVKGQGTLEIVLRRRS